MEKQYKDETAQLKLERIVLIIFSIYTIAMFVVAQLGGWNIFIKETMIVTVVIGWAVWVKRYRDHTFRAKFISVMAWINLCTYALHTHNFLSMLSTMAGMIVLLGIFCIPWIIYLGLFISTGVFLYHGLIVKTLALDSVGNIIGTFLQILSIYTVSGITWIVIRTQQETRKRLMENIHELELAEQSKDDFVVNISHEIRTPINAVCGMSDAILQETLPMEVRRDVIDIQTAGRNLLATVSNILDFSELESGKMELAEESYNITSTITDIINMALTLQNGRKLELIVDCDADLPSNLLGDEQKFRRIVLNILDNAIKFTKEGGIILRIKSRKEEYGTNLVVSIRDSGIGMEPADMEKIFTGFSQVNSRRNREEGGIGLGLAITQALVYRMGGFITVKSTPGIGSCFSFTIPQKVLDETPIVSIKNKQHLYAAFYVNMEKYNYSIVREGYENSLRHIAEQLGIMIRISKNLSELKRRMEHDNYSHVFIGWLEYCEDKNFFEHLAREITVVLILDYGQETQMGSSMLRIYKPFTILSIAAVFNGQKANQNEEQHRGSGHGFIAPEAKVLVVDDNAMNLKVMARLLLPYQMKAVMAGSGQEALDKLNTMDFDCVFLDHMMPEMDGVEVLHRIRKKPGLYFQSLSVIAFTANAIGGAREMFLEEGFDDFIAKPIELSVLERILRRYIPLKKQIPVEEIKKLEQNKVSTGAEGDGSTEAIVAQSSEDETKALELLKCSGINIQQGIAYCGDKEGLRQIIQVYCEEGPKRNCKLQQFFQAHDWKNYVIMVHALKSNSKGIGADELSELARNLELAGKENRVDYIMKHHKELLEKHEMLLDIFGASAFVYPEGRKKSGKSAEETGNSVNGNYSDNVERGSFDVDKDYAWGDSGQDAVSGEERSTGMGVSSDKERIASEGVLSGEEMTSQALAECLDHLKEKLDSFESEGIDAVLDIMENRQYDGTLLSIFTKEIREKVDEFDFLGASDVVSAWELEHPVG